MKKFFKWALIIFAVITLIAVFSEDDTEGELSGSESDSAKDNEIHAEDKEEATASESEGENAKDEEDKADYDALEKDFNDFADNSQGIILDIQPNHYTESYQQMEVYVDGNVWEASTDTEKIEFAESVHSIIADNIYGHNVLDPSESVYLTIFDQNGYELAKQSIFSGKFEIER